MWILILGSVSSFSTAGMGQVWFKANVVRLSDDEQEKEEDEREEAGEGEEEEEEDGEGEGLGQEHDRRAVREHEGSEWPPEY